MTITLPSISLPFSKLLLSVSEAKSYVQWPHVQWPTATTTNTTMTDSKVHCDLCGSYKIDNFVTIQQFKLAICRNCGLVFRLPYRGEIGRQKHEISSAYYSHKFNSRTTANPAAAIASGYDWKKADQVVSFLRKAAFNFENKRLIDIGCGVGYFLSLSQALGAKVLGIDISPVARDLAQKMFCVEVDAGKFPESFSQSHFKADLITFNDSLEHLTSPSQALSLAAKWLAPDGKIFIRTPDISYCKNRHTLAKWRLLQPQDHRYLFSGTSLRKLLGSRGLRTVRRSRASGWLFVLAEPKTPRADKHVDEGYEPRLGP